MRELDTKKEEPMDRATKIFVIGAIVLLCVFLAYCLISFHQEEERMSEINRKTVEDIMSQKDERTGLTMQQTLAVTKALSLYKAGKTEDEIIEELRAEYGDEDAKAALLYIINEYGESGK